MVYLMNILFLLGLEGKMRPLRLSEINLLKDIPEPMPEARSLFLFEEGNM